MVVFALYVCALLSYASAHIYERCELARELVSLGVDREHIATWVCIAYHESRFDTAARNPSSGDHGLLQISELYWCGPGKACGVPCSAFRDEDISDDLQCAHRIYKEHTRLQGDGFLAWVVYPHHCKHNAKKFLVDCEGHLKNVTVKTDNRGRSLRTGGRKETGRPLHSNYRDIDKLKPSFLSINLLLDKHGNQYENDEYRTNWVNFKVDDIDSLKLPELSKNGIYQFTTPPTTTTTNKPKTTTIDPNLIGIKPPMPRKIETNQFRRKFNTISTNINQINTYDNNKQVNETPQTYWTPKTTSPTASKPQEDIFESSTNRPNFIKTEYVAVPFYGRNYEEKVSTTKAPSFNRFWQRTESPITFTSNSPFSSWSSQTSTTAQTLTITNGGLTKANITYPSVKPISIVKSDNETSTNLSARNYDRRYIPFTSKKVYNWTTSAIDPKKLTETTISVVVITNSLENFPHTSAPSVNGYVRNTYSSPERKIPGTNQQTTTTTPVTYLPSSSTTRNYYYTTAGPLTSSTYKDVKNYASTEKIFTNVNSDIIPTITSTKTRNVVNNAETKFTTEIVTIKPESNFYNYYFTTRKPSSAVKTNPTNVTSNKIQNVPGNTHYYFTTAKPLTTTNRYQITSNTNSPTKTNTISQNENVKGSSLSHLFTNKITDTEDKPNGSVSNTHTNGSFVNSAVQRARPELPAINLGSNVNATTKTEWRWQKTVTTEKPSTYNTASLSNNWSTTTIRAPVFTANSKSTEQTKSPEATTRKPSIFDLYLRPQHETLKPFQFTAFNNSRKFVIFSGGTTASPQKSQ